MTEPLDCLDDGRGGCRGPVVLRPSLTGTGMPIPRCDKHWADRLDKEQEYRETYPVNPPDWYDYLNAGEHWSEDY